MEQIVCHYRAAPDGPSRMERLTGRATTAYYEQQIKDIVKETCEILEEVQDELFLYGFGRGAFIVRAVAGLLNAMHLPKRTSLKYFDRLYQSALDVHKARHEDDNTNGPAIVEFLRTHTTFAPQIRFVGVFDTVNYAAEGHIHDISLVPSIKHMRHALALNETRSQLNAEAIETPSSEEMHERSFVQAWFVGSNQDLGGGAREDGLSLYPLQWILMESMRAGLVIQSEDQKQKEMGPTEIKHPLALAFPQYAGEVPKLDGIEKIEWQIRHANGIQVSLFDLQSLHGSSPDEDQSHNVQINPSKTLYNSQRKVFSSKGLIGWCDTGNLHLSLFLSQRWMVLSLCT